ncbi:MAG TPA: LysM peptidoglycan-binding domain-containing protein [Chryseosolibacter sp.]
MDSIGMETINGQTFVIHRVEEKETLFAISRRYRTTVTDILRYNASASSGLEIGQILKVPYLPPARKPAGGLVHVVGPKETLYSISRVYQVSVDDLKRWNNLTDNALTIGQELVIKRSPPAVVNEAQKEQAENTAMISKKGVHTVQQKETLFSIARQYGISVDQLRAWNHLQGTDLNIGQTLFVVQPEQQVATRPGVTTPDPPVQTAKGTEPKTEPRTSPLPAKESPPQNDRAVAERTVPKGQSAESIRISESLKTGDEIVEGGLAELIEGTDGNRKYLALHRTAPMGTILKVRNEMNNREVFVRVMGKLPDTALTDKLIIRISKSAYDRLGAIDPRFRVEVTYYK